MKRFICTVLIIALMLIMGVGCEKQKINSKTTSKADKSDKENSVNTQTPTADPTDALVAPTNDVESSQPPKNNTTNPPAETYTLYYFYVDASNVSIVGFKNVKHQTIDDHWIETYNFKEYTQPGNYEIIIPETIDGRTVCNIDSGAFRYCDSIVSVTVPEGCTQIEAGTFLHGCREDIIIYGTKGSAAEEYAQQYNLTFCEIQ